MKQIIEITSSETPDEFGNPTLLNEFLKDSDLHANHVYLDFIARQREPVNQEWPTTDDAFPYTTPHQLNLYDVWQGVDPLWNNDRKWRVSLGKYTLRSKQDIPSDADLAMVNYFEFQNLDEAYTAQKSNFIDNKMINIPKNTFIKLSDSGIVYLAYFSVDTSFPDGEFNGKTGKELLLQHIKDANQCTDITSTFTPTAWTKVAYTIPIGLYYWEENKKYYNITKDLNPTSQADLLTQIQQYELDPSQVSDMITDNIDTDPNKTFKQLLIRSKEAQYKQNGVQVLSLTVIFSDNDWFGADIVTRQKLGTVDKLNGDQLSLFVDWLKANDPLHIEINRDIFWYWSNRDDKDPVSWMNISPLDTGLEIYEGLFDRDLGKNYLELKNEQELEQAITAAFNLLTGQTDQKQLVWNKWNVIKTLLLTYYDYDLYGKYLRHTDPLFSQTGTHFINPKIQQLP